MNSRSSKPLVPMIGQHHRPDFLSTNLSKSTHYTRRWILDFHFGSRVQLFDAAFSDIKRYLSTPTLSKGWNYKLNPPYLYHRTINLMGESSCDEVGQASQQILNTFAGRNCNEFFFLIWIASSMVTHLYFCFWTEGDKGSKP